MWFVEVAQQFVDLREVDEKLMVALYEKLKERSAAFQVLQKIHSDWQERQTTKRSPSNEELMRIFATLEKEHSEELHGWLTKFFAPMFLLGRWMSIDSYEELGQLLRSTQGSEPRLMFLKDYDESLSLYLSERTRDVGAWKKELPVIPQKGDDLIKNDARALAYLQAMNICLQERGKQVLFVTRSEDITEVVKSRPEWFSCVADRYFKATIDDPNRMDPRPVPILRDWIYFFELGAVWKPHDDIRPDIQSRLDRVRGMIGSLPEGNEIADEARKTFGTYFEEEVGLLNNIQTLWSAQGAKFRSSGRRWGNTGMERQPLLYFLRYVTNFEEFLERHRLLKEELKNVLNEINFSLPPVAPSVLKTSRYQPLLRSVLKVTEPSMFVRDIGDTKRQWMIEALLTSIKAGEKRVDPSSSLGRQIQALNKGEQLVEEPIVWLIHALHAYVYHSYSKARALILPQHMRRLPGLTEVVRLLVIADCWLIEHERLRQVDETLDGILRQGLLRSDSAIFSAILNARLQLELESSYEHGEDPESFRRNPSTSKIRLRECWEEVCQEIESKNVKALPDLLYKWGIENAVHAGARLTFTEEDPVGEVFTLPDASDVEKPIYIASKYVTLLQEWCQTSGIASHYDTIAYFYFKKACLSHGEERESLVKRAAEYLREAQRLIGQRTTTVDGTYEKRLVMIHWELINRMTQWSSA